MASPVEAEDSGSEDAVLSSEEEEDSAEVLLVFPPTMVLAEVQPARAESVSRPASANAQSFLSFIWFYPFVLYKNRENFGGFCCHHALNIAHEFTKIKKRMAN